MSQTGISLYLKSGIVYLYINGYSGAMPTIRNDDNLPEEGPLKPTEEKLPTNFMVAIPLGEFLRISKELGTSLKQQMDDESKIGGEVNA